MAHVLLREPEENTGRNGDHRQQEHPRQLPRGVHVAVKEMEKHQHGEHALHRRKPLEIVVEPAPHHPQKHQLQNQQQRHEAKPAEHHPQDALCDSFFTSRSTFSCSHFFSFKCSTPSPSEITHLLYMVSSTVSPVKKRADRHPGGWASGVCGYSSFFSFFFCCSSSRRPTFFISSRHSMELMPSRDHRQSDLMPHGPTSCVL